MRQFYRILAGAFFGGVILYSGCTDAPRNLEAAPSGMLRADQHFVLTDLKNQSVSLDGLLKQNKAVLLNFWASWCPPCREEIPDLIGLDAKNKSRGFSVVGINFGESSSRVQTFVEKMRMSYLILLDKDGAVAENYRVVGIPTSLLVSSDGKVLGEYHAFTAKLVADVEKALQP